MFAVCLEDPCVTVRVEDVAVVIRAAANSWDAILPDVDFTRRLKKVGFTVVEVPTRAGKKRGT